MPKRSPRSEEIERRWSTHHDRGAHDYTDAGCRVLAEAAFKDVRILLDLLAHTEAERDANYAQWMAAHEEWMKAEAERDKALTLLAEASRDS